MIGYAGDLAHIKLFNGRTLADTGTWTHLEATRAATWGCSDLTATLSANNGKIRTWKAGRAAPFQEFTVPGATNVGFAEAGLLRVEVEGHSLYRTTAGERLRDALAAQLRRTPRIWCSFDDAVRVLGPDPSEGENAPGTYGFQVVNPQGQVQAAFDHPGARACCTFLNRYVVTVSPKDIALWSRSGERLMTRSLAIAQHDGAVANHFASAVDDGRGGIAAFEGTRMGYKNAWYFEFGRDGTNVASV